MADLYIDSDSHAVYASALRAVQRHALELFVVTKDYLPTSANVHLIATQDGQMSGSNWIVANIARGDICVTADSELAVNCIFRGAAVLTPTGRQWGVDAIGDGAKGLVERRSPGQQNFAERLEKIIVSRRAGARVFAPSPGFTAAGFAGFPQRTPVASLS